MTTFCTNYASLNTKSLYDLLGDCDTNVKDIGSASSPHVFRSLFSQTPQNENLSQACGIANSGINASDNIYTGVGEKAVINQNIKNAVIDSATFYNFWSVQANAVNLADNFIALFAGDFTGEFADNYYPYLNPLISKLFYYLVCTVSPKGSTPALRADDPNVVVLNNWKYFLANIRGISGIQTCNFCIDDYIMPAVGVNTDNAGGIIRNLLSNNPFLRGWCGCCIPQSKDHLYNKKNYNFLNPFITKNNTGDYPLYCEPVCNNPGPLNDITNESLIIPLISGVSTYVNAPIPDSNPLYEVPVCSDTICVISDIEIKTIASKGGGINFKQVCPGCAASGNEGKCICYLTSTGVADKISAGDSGMQDPATFRQYCPNASCYRADISGNYKEVKCNTVNPGDTGKGAGNNYDGTGVFNNLEEANVYGIDTWLFPISFLVAFIILFLGAIFVTVYRNRVMPRMRQENDN